LTTKTKHVIHSTKIT